MTTSHTTRASMSLDDVNINMKGGMDSVRSTYSDGPISQTGIIDGVSVKSDQTFSSEESMRATRGNELSLSGSLSQNNGQAVSYLQALTNGTSHRKTKSEVRIKTFDTVDGIQKDNFTDDLKLKDYSTLSNEDHSQTEQEGANTSNTPETIEQDDNNTQITDDINDSNDCESDVDTVIITGSESDTINICQADDEHNSVSLNPEADEFTLSQDGRGTSHSLNPDASEFTVKTQTDKENMAGRQPGNGVFLPKSFQYPPPLPIAYDQTMFPLPSSKESSSFHTQTKRKTPNSIETQDTFIYPDSQSTDYTKYPSSNRSSRRFRTPPPSPMRMRAPPMNPYVQNVAYVQHLPYSVPFRQPYKMGAYPMPQGYNQQYPPQYSAYPPMYVKHPQYVPNAQFYGQVPAQYIVPYTPQYGGMVNMRVPQGYVPQHVVHDTCAIQCGVQCMDIAHMQNMQGQGYAYPNPAYPRRSYLNRSAYYNNKRRERMMGAMATPPPPPPPPRVDAEHASNAEDAGNAQNAQNVENVEEHKDINNNVVDNMDTSQIQGETSQIQGEPSQIQGDEGCEMQEMQEIQTCQEQIEELLVENQL